jgi:hypothetical protein
MSTRELITKLVKEYPNASNAELARLAVAEGSDKTERALRKMASSVKGGTGSTRKPNPTASPMNLQDNIKTQSVSADGTKELSYKGKTSITSLEEAVDFFEIDTDVWTVANWTCNSWDAGDSTNYQVKVRLDRKTADEYTAEDFDNLLTQYKNTVTKVKRRKVKGAGTGVAVLADFHIGAKVEDMMQTDDFSYEVVVDRLKQAADQINRMGYKKVEIALLGDFIETFTGLNHMNSWQQLEYGGYGANVTIIAYNIIRDFIAQINNLGNVTVVSGNHDRTTVKADVETESSICLHTIILACPRMTWCRRSGSTEHRASTTCCWVDTSIHAVVRPSTRRLIISIGTKRTIALSQWRQSSRVTGTVKATDGLRPPASQYSRTTVTDVPTFSILLSFELEGAGFGLSPPHHLCIP